jgi:hypothetical protein
MLLASGSVKQGIRGKSPQPVITPRIDKKQSIKRAIWKFGRTSRIEPCGRLRFAMAY